MYWHLLAEFLDPPDFRWHRDLMASACSILTAPDRTILLTMNYYVIGSILACDDCIRWSSAKSQGLKSGSESSVYPTCFLTMLLIVFEFLLTP